MVVVPSLCLLAWLSANHCGCRNATLVRGSVVALLSSVVGAEEGGCGCHCSGCSGWLAVVCRCLVVRSLLWLVVVVVVVVVEMQHLLVGGSVVTLLSSVVGAEEGGCGCHCSGCSGWLLFVVVSLSDRRCGWLLPSLLLSLWLLSKWEAVLLLFFPCSVVGAEEGIFGCHCSVGAAVAGCL